MSRRLLRSRLDRFVCPFVPLLLMSPFCRIQASSITGRCATLLAETSNP